MYSNYPFENSRSVAGYGCEGCPGRLGCSVAARGGRMERRSRQRGAAGCYELPGGVDRGSM